MQKKNLLITNSINEEFLPLLEKHFTITKHANISSQDLSTCIDAYDVIITRSPTAIPASLIQTMQRTRIIGRAAIGVDNIDIQEATKKRIAVINAPRGNAISTAEHTIGMMFSLMRHISQAHQDLKKGVWGKQKYIGTQLWGKTLGIVGFGNVGKEVCRIAEGIGMDILVCEPYVTLPSSVTKCTFDQLLSSSDIITFHVPSTYLTKHMMNTSTIKRCRPGTYIINCSRGTIVDEQAIIQALTSGHIGGFAVDVYEKEPQVSPHLLSFPNVVATPHIAGSTNESQRESVKEVVHGILQYLEGKAPHNLLNPQVFEKKEKKSIRSGGYSTIIFDCDSTLCEIEGIDELAGMHGKKTEIVSLTKKAMDGTASFEDVYRKRLEIIHPYASDISKIGTLYIEHLVEDAKYVIEILHLLKKKVYIVSSGYWESVAMLADYLRIPRKNVFGNDVMFSKSGKYVGLVEGPLIRNHGKLQIIRQLSGKKVMVGDSITDMESSDIVDLFVGYGGVIKRKSVFKQSNIFISCKSMTPLLPLICSQKELKSLVKTPYKKFIGKGIDLLSHPDYVRVTSPYQKAITKIQPLAYY